jgi:hypothetical protein
MRTLEVGGEVVVTRDPDEGVNAAGVIVTGVAAGRVPAVYAAAVSDCTAVVRTMFGDRLHSLYLCGSAATGQARPPGSDLDLLAVWSADTDAAAVTATAEELSTRHAGLVREVALGGIALVQVLADDRPGLGWRCFLRHYCTCLTGTDLRPSLPPCTPSRAVADAFNDDVDAPAQRWRRALTAPAPADIAAVARTAARKLLLVTATLESVEHGGWTTDRATGAALLTTHHPEWTDIATLALTWCTDPATPTTADIHRLLDLGDWLTARPRQAPRPSD